MRGTGSRGARRVAFVLVAAAVIAAPTAAGAGAGARANPHAPRLMRPASTTGASRTTVIVELDAPPVAAASLGGSKSGRAQLRTVLRADQVLARDRIVAAGGTIRASYQLVLNGFSVSIASDRVGQLARLSGVKRVSPIHQYALDNSRVVPYVGGPQAWSGFGGVGGRHGEGIKIGIVDTGIDYTHADFGGPGTPAAYQAALATDTAPADPALFGPGAPRVKGGTDLVGDAYTGGNTPVSDPNPLDCDGHGTHVAGTAAGTGVLLNGKT